MFYNFILFVKYFIEFFIVKNISSVFSNVSIYNDALQVLYQNRLHILRVVFKKVGGKGEIVGKRNCKGRGIFESFSPLTLILNTDCYHHISFMIKSLHRRFALLYQVWLLYAHGSFDYLFYYFSNLKPLSSFIKIVFKLLVFSCSNLN